MTVSNLRNYQNFKIFFTFLLLWFSVQFGDVVEDTVAYILVISIGILHGANDLLIISKNKKTKNSFIKNLTIYLSIILICVLLFFVNSFLAILLFILLSAYHFGEEHFSDLLDISKYFNVVFFISYGILIFSIIFYTSLKDVNFIMDKLSGSSFSKNQILISLILSFICFCLLNFYLIVKKEIELVDFGKELFYILLLSLVFKSTSLILGFAIYFIFWHSLPSIIHQVIFISGKFSKNSFIFYVKQAVIYWLISIIAMLSLYFLIPEIDKFSIFIFVTLFAVTAPHVWVMHQMKN